jgi:tetratricopeptide (TPR) repeat protein/predicted aspartyl protease
MSPRVLWIAVALLGFVAAVPRALAGCKLVKRFELPVTMRGTLPMVRAKINGSDVLFLADSGSFASTLTPEAAADLKLHLEPAPVWFAMTGIGGESRAWLTRVDTFTLVSLTVPKVEFIVAGNDLAGGAVGVLGQNVLRIIGDVEYDLANGVIRLFRADDCRKAALAYWASDKPYSVVDIAQATPERPYTTGTALLNGAKIRVRFDTGASASMLTLDAAKRAGVTPESAGVVAAGTTYGGWGRRLVKTWIAPFPSFKIGEEEIRNTHLRIGAMSLGDTDMLVGADFFLSHRVYVANGQAKLYFTYNGGPVFDLTATANATAARANGGPANAAATGVGPNASAAPAAGAEGAGAGAALSAPGAAPASRDQPTDAAGFGRRGSAYAARRDFEHAIADLTRACELAPGEANYFYQRGQAYWGNRQPDLALADFDQALKLRPDDLPALLARADLHAWRQENRAAIADLDAADRIAPKGAQARMHMGDLYAYVRAYPAAIAQYSTWFDTHGRDDVQSARVLNSRCWTRAMWGQELGQALADCDRALKLQPDNATYLDSRGLVRLRRGEYAQAIADYTRALKLQPGLAWSHYGRGVAELREGMTDQGQADINAAIKLQPHIADEARQRDIGP